MKIQGLTHEQHAKLGDYVVWDAKTQRSARDHARRCRRDDGGNGIDPVLEGTFKVEARGREDGRGATLWTLYQVHLKDYDLDTRR